MPKRPRPQAQVIRLLRQDVAATVGPEHEAAVIDRAVEIREFVERSYFEQRLVDDIQQYLHDTFVDSTWPACPRHPNHPLWFSDGSWRCERDDVAVVALGKLESLTP